MVFRFAPAPLPANRRRMKITRIARAAYGIALLIIVLDQLTKAWILSLPDVASVSQIPVGYVFAEVLPPILRFTFVQNTGVSFGLFGGGEARWGLTIFSVIVSAGLAWWATQSDRRLLITAIGFVMGGALGNVIDRIRFGYVVDFIDVSGTGVFPWVFNIADSAITIGVVLLILDSFLSDKAAKVGAAPEKS
ncbi:lipoprotein signal peptidase [Brevundimonas intermedia]|uniref:Lipoprotein signal peptidase n=2 Tax=Brevundimonas intermedia TaxID=74315 RepID=A0ABQ5T751_9CAUL|nr:lipoprotein signal peptidase [Brevundimonas intermedia]